MGIGTDTTVLADLDTLKAAIGAIEGATTLHNKLTAARAALLEQVTALRMAELDAANLPADLDTLLLRFTAARAALLDEITALRLAELDAANLPADLDTLKAAIGAIEGATTLHNKLTAARAALLEQVTALRMAELDAANLPADVAAIKAKTDTLPPKGRRVFPSDIAASVAVTNVAGDKTLPSVTIPAGVIPSGTTIARVLAAATWRKQVDSSAAQNSVSGDQVLQVRSDAPGTWRDGINLANGTLLTAASGTEGGPLIIGDNDIKAEVTGPDTYEFKWASATVTGASLTFYDCQTFLIVDFE